MLKKKRATKIVDALNTLNKTDIYSLMLFTLYKMRDIPKYATLSELCYVLDGDNLSKFLSFYGGMTITIPTVEDMRLILKALMLYQYVNLENEDFEEALKAVSDEFPEDEIREVYQRITDIIKDYDFRRD